MGSSSTIKIRSGEELLLRLRENPLSVIGYFIHLGDIFAEPLPGNKNLIEMTILHPPELFKGSRQAKSSYIVFCTRQFICH
jgi:hypothetical protein